MREAEELMKEFSDNPMFSDLFGGLTEMLHGSDKETGNDGSARRRAVQERLRKKMDAKKATASREAGGGSPFSKGEATASASATATATVGQNSSSSAAAQAAIDAELEAAFAPRGGAGGKKK